MKSDSWIKKIVHKKLGVTAVGAAERFHEMWQLHSIPALDLRMLFTVKVPLKLRQKAFNSLIWDQISQDCMQYYLLLSTFMSIKLTPMYHKQ